MLTSIGINIGFNLWLTAFLCLFAKLVTIVMHRFAADSLHGLHMGYTYYCWIVVVLG